MFIVEPMPPSLQRPGHRGCRGGALPRSFPGFSRARETGPPEVYPRQGKTLRRLIPHPSPASVRRRTRVPHPLVICRVHVPFAAAPAAPGRRGGAPPRSFPDFSRVREIGPPEASSSQISRAAHPRFPKEAANACLRSIAPPLQTEADASVWETAEGGRKTLPICR